MNRRKTKLIRPGLQLRWSLLYVLASAAALVLQATLTNFTLSRLAAEAPNDGAWILRELPRYLTLNLAVSLGILVPFLTAVVVLTTFRVAGPLHNIERYLEDLVAGRRPEPIRLRKGDQLRELAELVNEATAARRDDEGPAEESLDDGLEDVPSLVRERTPTSS